MDILLTHLKDMLASPAGSEEYWDNCDAMYDRSFEIAKNFYTEQKDIDKAAIGYVEKAYRLLGFEVPNE